jgi:hypothetical protein
VLHEAHDFATSDFGNVLYGAACYESIEREVVCSKCLAAGSCPTFSGNQKEELAAVGPNAVRVRVRTFLWKRRTAMADSYQTSAKKSMSKSEPLTHFGKGESTFRNDSETQKS